MIPHDVRRARAGVRPGDRWVCVEWARGWHSFGGFTREDRGPTSGTVGLVSKQHCVVGKVRQVGSGPSGLVDLRAVFVSKLHRSRTS